MQISRAPVLLLLPFALALGGCVDTVGQAKVETVAAPTKVARRDGVSPRGATVALAAVEGAPQAVADRFTAAFAQSAAAAEITTVEGAKADYVLRAYLSAAPEAGGVARFSYVVDMFDRQRRRVQRLTDDLAVKGAAADVWALAGDQTVRALADRSAADLADALTNTPEAIAGGAIASAAPKAGETRISQSGTTAVERTAGAAPRLGFAAAR